MNGEKKKWERFVKRWPILLLALALPGWFLSGERAIDYRTTIWSDIRPASSLTHIFAGETTECEPYNGYLIFQGGIPEVEEFIKKFHK